MRPPDSRTVRWLGDIVAVRWRFCRYARLHRGIRVAVLPLCYVTWAQWGGGFAAMLGYIGAKRWRFCPYARLHRGKAVAALPPCNATSPRSGGRVAGMRGYICGTGWAGCHRVTIRLRDWVGESGRGQEAQPCHRLRGAVENFGVVAGTLKCQPDCIGTRGSESGAISRVSRCGHPAGGVLQGRGHVRGRRCIDGDRARLGLQGGRRLSATE